MKLFVIILSFILATFPSQGYAQYDRDLPYLIKAQTQYNTQVDSAIFAAPSSMISPKISPNGRYVAYQERSENIIFLVVKDFEAKKINRIETPEITWFAWAGSNRLLTKVNLEKVNTNYYVLNLKDLSYDPVGHEGFSPSGTSVIYIHPSGEYFLQSKQADASQTPSVFKVEVADNIVTRLVKPQKNIWDWYVDNAGIVRVGMASFFDKVKIYYRRSNEEKFVLSGKVNTKDPNNKERQSLLAFNDIVVGSDEGYVMSNQATGRFSLYKYNYLTGETGEIVYSHTDNDINNYRLSIDGKKLLSVTYTEDRDRVEWFDPQVSKIQSLLEKALPGQEIWMGSRSDDGNRIIVYSISSTDPGSFYLYDNSINSLDRLGGINDAINPKQLSETKYLNYTARDGLIINTYLTLPKSKEAKNLPLIILPHGGPYGVRDNGDYDPEVQFLANRGYGVLQPNFRGSESYGEEFFELGEGQIGRKMQDDLDDGMDWLAGQGIIDKSRVCIVGSSYGGYAALWGVIRNPERYRCAASFAGVTAFNEQLKYDKRFFNSRYARNWRDIVRGDEDFNLDSVSPLYQITKLKRPVLLTHGNKDSVVPFNQYKKMVKAAKKYNIQLETHVYKGEGHGLSKEENRVDWYNRLEAFLTKHNPAD